MIPTQQPTFAEFAIAIMAYDVASQQLAHLEDFIGNSNNYMEWRWAYLKFARNLVNAYRAYNAVVDRMYA